MTVTDDEGRRRFGSIVAGIGKFFTAGKNRGKAPSAPYDRRVPTGCASNGHTYRAHESGWRCGVCGNHVPRRDGELYGPAAEGRTERRREDR